MRKFVFFLVGLGFFFFPSVYSQTQNYDVIGVRTVLGNFVKAWNTHDPQNMVALWADDGDLVSSWGKWGRGKNNVERILREEQLTDLKQTTMEQTIDSIRFFQPDLVFVDATSTLSGGTSSIDGKPLFLEHHIVYLLQKKDNSWKVVSVRPYILQGRLTKVK